MSAIRISRARSPRLSGRWSFSIVRVAGDNRNGPKQTVVLSSARIEDTPTHGVGVENNRRGRWTQVQHFQVGGLARARRQAPGLSPTNLRNRRVKWAWS